MLTLRILDEHGVPTCAHLQIIKSGDVMLYQGYARDGFQIEPLPDHESVCELRLTASRGKFCYPIHKRFLCDPNDQTVELRFRRLLDPKQLGLYKFDAHSHVSRELSGQEAIIDLPRASVWMKGEDVNLFVAGTPFDGEQHRQEDLGITPDYSTYREHYADQIAEESCADFLLDVNTETIKYRYGHICLANYAMRPPSNIFRDAVYTLYENEINTPGSAPPPFINIPPARAILSLKEPHSMAFSAHPTSWWRAGKTDSFITNIASTISFDVLTGAIDAMVVMGYWSDKPAYRALWYEMLNAGYRLTGIAETDICMDRKEHARGLRMCDYFTFAHAAEFTEDAIMDAVRAGDCIATTGPLINLTVNGARMGSVLPFGDSPYHVHVSTIACCEGEVVEVTLIQNGREIAHVEGPELLTDITFPKEGYVLALARDASGNLAIANPVYVRSTPFVNENFRANVQIRVLGAERGTYHTDENPEELPFEKSFSVSMNPASRVFITANHQQKVYEPFFDPQLQEWFRYLYSGAFLQGRRGVKSIVEPEHYRIHEIREHLQHLHTTIVFDENSEAGEA